jgi:hypothetical protein
LRGVEQTEEEAQVVLAVEAGPARHNLAVEVAVEHIGILKVDLTRQQFAGLAVPVAEEDGLDASDNRPLHPGDKLLPLQAAADIAALVVRAVDDVLRTHEGNDPVDHEELAVVAQVRPLEFAAPRLQRKHQVPVGADSVEAAFGTRR